MTWQVKWRDNTRKELRGLDREGQTRILKYLRDRIATNEDPRRFGKTLKSNFSGLWRYRIGNYRLISEHLTSTELERIPFYRSGANQSRDI